MLSVLVEDARKNRRIAFTGELCRSELEKRSSKYLSYINKKREIILDLSNVVKIDTTGAGFLAAMRRRADELESSLALENVPPTLHHTISSFSWLDIPPKPQKTFLDRLAALGETLLATKNSVAAFLFLTADTILWSVMGAKRTQRVRRGAVWLEATRIGVDALGIITLIMLLVGIVLALQAENLLHLFGADIMVADMIGMSVTMELGPLMCAVIMSGRSGASIAAEIATMTINEEVAGIRTMGLEPVKYIVVPKFRAMTLTMPGLCVFAEFFGIVGGIIFSIIGMDVGLPAFLNELLNAIRAHHITNGLIKAVVFGWIIVLVAAHQGFRAYGGADSVGRVTTSSVVLSLFWCIVADAIFSMIFYL